MKLDLVRTVLALVTGAAHTMTASAAFWDIGTGRWSGAVDLSLEQSGHTTQSPTGESSASTRNLRETVRVLGTGLYLLDPRLVKVNLGLQVNFNNNRNASSTDGVDSPPASGSDRFVGYNFDAAILDRKPYPMSLYANRSQSQSNQSFGGRTEGVFENRGFNLKLKEDSFLQNWGGPWLSADISLRQESHQDTTTFMDRVNHRSDARRTFDFSAAKGFTTADLSVRYHAADQQNGAQAAIQAQSAGLGYSLDFGPGLNRHMGTSLSYATRNGESANSALSATQILHIDHFRNLSTDYAYGYTKDEVDGALSVQQTGSFSIAHQLYENLSTGFALNVSDLTIPNGSMRSYDGQFSQNYQHSLPGGGGLNLNWSGGYARNTNALASGLVYVPAESHTSPPNLQSFDLVKSFVVESSIVVRNKRLAPSPAPVRELLIKDVDYRVDAKGTSFIITPLYQAVSLPTDPIYAGDALEVSYIYEVDPSAVYLTRSAGFGATVSYGWISGAYQHRRSRQLPLMGESRFLTSTQDDSVRLTLRGSWLELQTQADASHLRSITTDLSGDSQEDTSKLDLQASGRVWEFDTQANASLDRYRAELLSYNRSLLSTQLTWRPVYNVTASFGAAASNVHYLTPERQAATRSARASVNWISTGGWSSTAFSEIRTHSESARDSQTIIQVGGSASRRWGKLSVSSSASFDHWVSGGTRSDSQSINLTASRAF